MEFFEMKLLTTGNPKVMKGTEQGFLTSILHLAPATLSGYEVCPSRSTGCTNACLNISGMGGIFKIGEDTNTIQQSRIRKTRWFFEDRKAFLLQLAKDISSAIRLADKHKLVPVFRLNGTSDIRWENYGIIEQFDGVQFYDYTKLPNRRNLPTNYHLTFSRSESNEHYVPMAFDNGMNVAVVFRKDGAKVKRIYTLAERLANKEKRERQLATRDLTRPKKPYKARKVDLSWVPTTFYDKPVFHGDNSDLRFLDPKGSVVALLAKGNAKYDTSGFIVDIHTK
jgi:hypothetical protein